MDRYIGLDVHASSCTIAVVGPGGRRLQSQVLETSAPALIDFLKRLPRPRHLCMEEGTQSAWLYEVLSRHADEIVVAGLSRRLGSKSDQHDAFDLAEELRTDTLQKRVYKGTGEWGAQRELARGYAMLVNDVVRVKNRIKSVYRSRGIPTGARAVYGESARVLMVKKLPARMQVLIGTLYRELQVVQELRDEIEKALLTESHRHKISRILETCPGLGPIRVAQLLPVVVTPYRFSNKRAFWAYSGMGVVTRSSSDWVRTSDGQWSRMPVQQARGLTRSFNHTLKWIFKGAATTVIHSSDRTEPLRQHYEHLLQAGTKPNLAKLTIARQIASIALAMWRVEEVYDPKKMLVAA